VTTICDGADDVVGASGIDGVVIWSCGFTGKSIVDGAGIIIGSAYCGNVVYITHEVEHCKIIINK